jgi:GT2 family glycosyltransferase
MGWQFSSGMHKYLNPGLMMESIPGDAPPCLLTIIVVNWNGEEFVSECLESLRTQTWPNKEIIIVDNGSTDRSREILKRWELEDTVLILWLKENTGFTKANNLAFGLARGEWIALLNNDAVADPQWLEKLMQRRNSAQGIGMLGGKVLLYHARDTLDKAGHLIYWDGLNRGRGTGQRDAGQFDREEEIIWPDGCASIYHRKLIEETGGFDEDFFAYGDDADLGMRARLLGWKGWYVPDAVVYHRHSATAGKYSPLKAMLVERNRIFLALKNFPLSLLCQNPFWTLRRYLLQAMGAIWGVGSSGRFAQQHGRLRLLKTLAWAYLSAFGKALAMVKKRRDIQRHKVMSNREVKALLKRFQIDVRELTLRE